MKSSMSPLLQAPDCSEELQSKPLGELIETEILFTQKYHKCVELKSAADPKKCFCVAHP